MPAIAETRLASYVETALWSSIEGADNDNRPLDENYSIADLSPECRAKMQADVDAFFAKALDADLLDADGQDDAHVAHDFWLTRNHHGAGFWDGDYPAHGDALTALAHSFGEVNLEVGDDGQIHAF